MCLKAIIENKLHIHKHSFNLHPKIKAIAIFPVKIFTIKNNIHVQNNSSFEGSDRHFH